MPVLKAPSQSRQAECDTPSLHRHESTIELTDDLEDLVVFFQEWLIGCQLNRRFRSRLWAFVWCLGWLTPR